MHGLPEDYSNLSTKSHDGSPRFTLALFVQFSCTARNGHAVRAHPSAWPIGWVSFEHVWLRFFKWREVVRLGTRRNTPEHCGTPGSWQHRPQKVMHCDAKRRIDDGAFVDLPRRRRLLLRAGPERIAHDTADLLYPYQRRCARHRKAGPLSKLLADERRPGRAILTQKVFPRGGFVI
jgi:hypothetical protein